MTDWIRVRARLMLSRPQDGDAAATPDQIGVVARQLAADAVYGSFGEFNSAYWRDKWAVPPDQLANVTVDLDPTDPKTSWATMRLSADLYDIQRGGLQHFLGVLAGDLFFLKMPGLAIQRSDVVEVELPSTMLAQLEKHYRAEAYTVERIRSAFNLSNVEPLLAFSFKPRVGLTRSAIREITLGVLEAGFHIVEFDTRFLDLTEATVYFMLELAKESVQVGAGRRVTRLSPNLSVAAPLAVRLCDRFSSAGEWPHVIKIDGGFDGISTIQAIRQELKNTAAPIITCYPLLRDQLRSKIPPAVFVQALAYSGADIIYPGGTPPIGKSTRELGTDAREAVGQATRRYQELSRRAWPMVTFAGGVHAGQLHAYYELVGPNVAYFLGGAISLHRDGPIAGARLCANILNAAAERHRSDYRDVDDLPAKMIAELEDAYEIPPGADADTFHYVSPRDLCSGVSVPRW